MGVIRLLDDHLANQIAAGEVVERPSSVLKELIENAVDAGATTIDVTAEEGGLALLRIVDNGSGILPEDLPTAFERHATSKIASGKDLFQIATLGFRGEALPSIAAVAKVRCLSATDSSGLGRVLEIEGGVIKRHEDAAAPKGTDMTVRELFYNTPARLKYMKTVQTELSHLSDVMYRQALARPDIAFTFTHNGSTLLRTPGNGDLRQVVAAIYGTAAAKAMVPLSAEHPDYALGGLTAMPVETRSNRNAITVLVNGRYIRSAAIVQPLLQAYHTLLPVNRYPLAVLHLRMHPSLLDVNVHPSKMEVRFSKENELRAFVEEAVRKALGERAYIPSGTAVRQTKTPPWVQEQLRFRDAAASDANDAVGAGGTGDTRGTSGLGGAAGLSAAAPAAAGAASIGASPGERPGADAGEAVRRNADAPLVREAGGRLAYGTGPAAREAAAGRPYGWPAGRQPSGAVPAGGNGSFAAEGRPASPPDRRVWEAAYAPPDSEPKAEFPELHWIGQLHGTYIVAQNENGLYLIDQHAAHERINYEYFFDKFGRPQDASQELLLPVTLSFAPDEFALLRTRLHLFEQVGVYMEEFGGNTLIVRAVPHWFPEGDEGDIVREMAEWILKERSVDLRKLREKASILTSCKASIKANQSLTRESGEALLRRLAGCRQPFTCPHGRPIVVSFSTYELEKMFKRVMS
ncbi:MAG: DNA mismatch repair endonuclease MutL [Cohnella sp.]|uniref:DNA mismatch repair endonuclease MutL n=1 Tax=Cohnella sp. TaxID=1883426 RepID=UPI000E3690AA|nr:DNA mismatch repair endonuclease MutL [Cohnella sp.]REK60496.1 MAG: DNA mismatch repair endonuclease MutL [Cohnella sp.]